MRQFGVLKEGSALFQEYSVYIKEVSAALAESQRRLGSRRREDRRRGRGQPIYTLFGPMDPKGRKIIAVKKKKTQQVTF